MDKIFAKPFVGNLSGHTDGISCMSKSPIVLTNFISGSFDGEIRFWDLSTRKTVFNIDAHPKIVKGLAFSHTGHHFISCGGDNKVKMFSV
jgi:WD repeat and SOF domain-containing protein 1